MNITTCLVIFDVSDIRFSAVVKKIHGLGNWARITANVYHILSYTKDCKTIREILREYIGNDGRLFVVETTDCQWASVNLPREVTNLLKKY